MRGLFFEFFSLSNMFNQCIKLDEKYVKNVSVCSNTSAYLLYPLRKMSVTKILQIMAQNRAETCCHQLIDCLLNTYKANENHDDETSSNSSVEIYRFDNELNIFKKNKIWWII